MIHHVINEVIVIVDDLDKLCGVLLIAISNQGIGCFPDGWCGLLVYEPGDRNSCRKVFILLVVTGMLVAIIDSELVQLLRRDARGELGHDVLRNLNWINLIKWRSIVLIV